MNLSRLSTGIHFSILMIMNKQASVKWIFFHQSIHPLMRLSTKHVSLFSKMCSASLQLPLLRVRKPCH